jgi:hypothetical protein
MPAERMSATRLTKPMVRVLEKCFQAELTGVPAQFAPGPHCVINGIRVGDAVARASADGLIEQVDHKLGGWPPVLIRGFVLTPQGYRAYCAWAAAAESIKDV